MGEDDRPPGEAPLSIDAIILDFDGLIVDTETPIYEAWKGAYESRGQSLGLDQWQHSLGTHGGFDAHAHLESLLGEVLSREELQREVRAASDRLCEPQPLLPGVETLLRDAQSRGLGRAVASSSSCRWVEGWLRRHGIRELLDVVVARDDVTRVKPDPELFLLAARRLDVAPERSVVFEDSPNGMRAALAAGMHCVAVPNALTRDLDRPEVDLVMDSLDARPLSEVLDAVRAGGAGA
ncbi:MAG: HAD family hydrolase [Acidobacteria bacterium]|nr:HAD family hydrolase [Acidobacteriota bacterium]